jgi:catechol 2,3-dioxygenase-like lactoylglutathione lyase family enzyme
MNLERIDHIGLNVRDLVTSAEFYSKVLDFNVVHKWTTTWMVGTDTIRLGLFQRSRSSPLCDIDNTIAITHVAFRTDAAGFAAAQSELTRLGVSFEPPVDTGIFYSIFFLDPDGHQIEINTYERAARLLLKPAVKKSTKDLRVRRRLRRRTGNRRN